MCWAGTGMRGCTCALACRRGGPRADVPSALCARACARLHGAHHRQAPGPVRRRACPGQRARVAGGGHQRPPGQQGHAHGQGSGRRARWAWEGCPRPGLAPLQDPVVSPGHPGLREPQGESPGPWVRGEAALEQAGAAGEAAHGRPGEAGEGASAGQALRGGAGAGAAWARAPGGLTAAPQVSEAKAQLRDAQDFWVSLPGTLCSEKMAMSPGSDDRCWNGVAKGR